MKRAISISACLGILLAVGAWRGDGPAWQGVDLDWSAVEITGGTIDGVDTGKSTPGEGHFTELSSSGQYTNTVTTGTAPYVVSSTTKVSNLNADTVDGVDFASPGAIGGTVAATALSISGQITSTLATGTAPLVVSSTTKVSNLNVDQVDGGDWASPGAIGTGTPAGGTFTLLTANSIGINNDAPKAIVHGVGEAATAGAGNVTTSGSSTTITFLTAADWEKVGKGTRIVANGATRTITAAAASPTATINSAVNWDNGGAGYTFTYQVAQQLWTDSSGNVDLVLTGDGQLGIGTTTPSTTLEVATGSGSLKISDYNIKYSTSVSIVAENGGYLGLNSDTGEVRVNPGTAGRAGTAVIGVAGESDQTVIHGNVGIGTTTPQGKIHFASEDTHGGLVLTAYSGSLTLTATTTCQLTLSIPSNAVIKGVQLHVKTALNAGETWNAYLGDPASEEAVAAAAAVAQNTNVSYWCHADAGYGGTLTDAVTNLYFQRSSNPGVDSFTAQGVIEAVVWAYVWDTWDNE